MKSEGSPCNYCTHGDCGPSLPPSVPVETTPAEHTHCTIPQHETGAVEPGVESVQQRLTHVPNEQRQFCKIDRLRNSLFSKLAPGNNVTPQSVPVGWSLHDIVRVGLVEHFCIFVQLKFV